MEEGRAELEAGRLSTTFLLLSPPPPREGAVVAKVDSRGSPCPNASLVDGQDQASVNLSSNNFPDDEAEEEEGPSAAPEGASLDSIGRLSDGPFDERPRSACTPLSTGAEPHPVLGPTFRRHSSSRLDRERLSVGR
jgi:hypothetical protein